MTDLATVFMTVALMTFANGVVLTIVSRDLPATLRSAARFWQLGTILIAGGCAAFAIGAPVPGPTMLVIANGGVLLGLTAYFVALQRLRGQRRSALQWLPAVVTTALIYWFSAQMPSFITRVFAFSLTSGWLMLASAAPLLSQPRPERPRSSEVLAGLLLLISSFYVLRMVGYPAIGVEPATTVVDARIWLNLVTPILMSLIPVVGTTCFLLICSDRLKQQLAIAAATDYLTGLPNRRTLASQGAHAFAAARREGRRLLVCAIDIDNFKPINDAHGHEGGDQALVHVAQVLSETCGAGGVLARTGGEEFALIIADADGDSALALVETLRRAIEASPVMLAGKAVSLTISAGVAFQEPGDASFDAVLRRADRALYQAKAAGRNRVERSDGRPLPVMRLAQAAAAK